MAVVDPKAPFVTTDAYWALVRETLRAVFDGDPRLADSFRHEITTLPADEQLVGYHSEPLDVAADLAGKDVTSDTVTRYRALARKLGWP